MSLIFQNPRPRAGVTPEYHRAVSEAFATLPEQPHEDPASVQLWMTRHGWNPGDFSMNEIELVGDVLSAVIRELTALIVEETPAPAADTTPES